VSWQGLRGEDSSLTAPQKSAEGIVGTRERAEGLNGGRESWPGVERRDGIRRGGARGSASGMNARLARREMTLRLGCAVSPGLNRPSRRRRDPSVRWCGRGEAARPLPIPIRRHVTESKGGRDE
jgi:hypothetical protein